MLDLQVVPERSLGNELWEFSLGMPLFQAVHILQRHCRVIKDVHVVYNEIKPFESDLVLNLINDGIRLIFDSKNQRLKIIEIYDLSKMKLKYCGAYFNSPEVQPTLDRIDQSFGATHPAQFDDKHFMFVLSFLGITFVFPVDPQSDISEAALRSRPNKQALTVGKICIYHGKNLNETSAPPMPLTCFQGDVYSEVTDVLLIGGKCDALQLKLVTGGFGVGSENKLQNLIRQIRFGDSAQDVLTELGSPCQTFYKLEDKMRIHSAGPHKLSPSQHSDYFFNYFTFGLDILFDGLTHRVKKFILHANHPGHYNFNIYYRCDFRIDLQGEKGQFTITPTSKWDSVMEKLGGPQAVGKPVVLNRASSTNNTNPFGSTHCFGLQNMIFEIMNNNYIASLTLYQPSDVAA